jgi:hypothetical protein
VYIFYHGIVDYTDRAPLEPWQCSAPLRLRGSTPSRLRAKYTLLDREYQTRAYERQNLHNAKAFINCLVLFSVYYMYAMWWLCLLQISGLVVRHEAERDP